VDGLGRRIRKEDSRSETASERNWWETQYDARGLVTMRRSYLRKEDASGAVTGSLERRTDFEYDGLARVNKEKKDTGHGYIQRESEVPL